MRLTLIILQNKHNPKLYFAHLQRIKLKIMLIYTYNLLLKHKIGTFKQNIADEKLYKSRFGRTRFLSIGKPQCNARFA
jgi:hypothetical protein